MNADVKRLSDMISKAKRVVFFGGAGVSTESGIPDFRSAHGLYSGAEGKSYEEMLSLRYFLNNVDDFWRFYKSVMLYPDAKPNPAHYALARLESQGKLKKIITQNIDGLHQAAGSKNVLELHGTVHSNSCMRCKKKYNLEYVLGAEGTPTCGGCDDKHCGGIIRPDIIMYGEPLNERLLDVSVRAVTECDLLIVGGTSLMVNPSAGLISYRSRNVGLALINRDPTPYDSLARLVIRDNIAEVLDEAIPNP